MSEIQKVLANEITPTLERLRSEKKHYLKWSANNTEIEKLQRLCVAYQYSHAAEEVEKSADELKQMEEERERYVKTASEGLMSGRSRGPASCIYNTRPQNADKQAQGRDGVAEGGRDGAVRGGGAADGAAGQ